MLSRICQVVFAPDHVRDLHFDIVDHVHKMKNPGAVWATNCHIRFHTAIEFDPSADLVINHNWASRRSKSDCSSILVNAVLVLEPLEILFIDRAALALKIRPKFTAFSGTFVPLQSKPLQTLINHPDRLVMFTTFIGVLDPEDKGTAVVPRKEPIEKGSSCSTHVQKTSWRRSKTNPNRSSHRRKDPLPYLHATEFSSLDKPTC